MPKNKLILICFIGWLSFVLFGCEKQERLEKVDLNETIELTEAPSIKKSELNVCVGSMITPQEGYAHYKALLDYIGGELNMRVNFIDKESYAEVNTLLSEGKIDVAFVCGGPYIEGKDKFGLELLAAPELRGESVYYSYIIVRKDSGIKKPEELKGKTFVFADPLSNSGKLYPTYLLRQMDQTPETFFKEYIYSYAHDTSIRAVSEGIVEGGAVDSLVWNYLEKRDCPFTKNIQIIHISPPYGIPPVVARPTLDRNLKDKIKQVLLDMHKDKKGRAILEKMSIDRFVQIDDFKYDSIRKIRQHLEEN